MEFITMLWLPILVSGVGLFFLSAAARMLSPHRKDDFGRLPDEDRAMRDQRMDETRYKCQMGANVVTRNRVIF